MKTYCAHHTGTLDIDDAEIARLRGQGLIAIHYPWDKHYREGCSDSQSLNPDDYEGKAKGAIRALNEASKEGGFIFATYRGQPKSLMGTVAPGTPIELFNTHWKSEPGRTAILKTLKLTTYSEPSSSLQARLGALTPQRSTFTRWPGIGDQVEHAVMGNQTPPSLSSMSVPQQEVMCSEYLRAHDLQDVPRLQALLMPVGRTMKDFDIVGIATDGRPLLAQVTFGTNPEKLERFTAHDDGTNHLVYFCGESEPRKIGNAHIIPLADAYSVFMATPVGAAWVRAMIAGL